MILSRSRCSLALLALIGLVSTTTSGAWRDALELPGPSGVWTEAMAPDDEPEGSAPADKARAGVSVDLRPVALLALQIDRPPTGESISLGTFEVDRCRPGHQRGIDYPPRVAV